MYMYVSYIIEDFHFLKFKFKLIKIKLIIKDIPWFLSDSKKWKRNVGVIEHKNKIEKITLLRIICGSPF